MRKDVYPLAVVLVLALGACKSKSEPANTEEPNTAQQAAAATAAQPRPALQPEVPQDPAKKPQAGSALPSRPKTITVWTDFVKDTSEFAKRHSAGGIDTAAAAGKAGAPHMQPMGLKGQPTSGDCAKCCFDGDCGNVCCFTPGGPENDPGDEPGHEPTDCGTCNRKSCINACEGPPPTGWTNEQCVAFCNCCSHN